jgi:hypothetical protein
MNHYFSTFLLAILAPFAVADVVIEGDGSTFIVSYDPIYDSAHQAVMNDAIQFWADSVVSGVPISVDVRAENFSCSFAYSSHVDTKAPEAVINFTNAPLANTYYPIALANAYAGTDLNPSKPDIVLRYSKRMITRTMCRKWYLGYDAGFEFTEVSLYFETMQEIAHGLGLHPLGDLMTGETLNGYDDIYWTQLKSTKLDKALPDMTASQVYTASHNTSDLAFAGEKAWAASSHLTAGRVNDGLLTFARSYDADKLTGIHLHESIRPKQLMMVDVRDVVPETELAVAMLEDLGWKTTRNTEPVITGHVPITVLEDSSYVLTLADLNIEDEAPESLSLSISSGSNYSVSGSTITPHSNFHGTLAVTVTVSDDEYTSEPFDITIIVSAVNDAPAITNQTSLTTLEDSALVLATSQFTIIDVDSTSFSLTVLPGDNYTVSGSTITPSSNFHGELTVPVQISDGATNSARFNAKVMVTSVNDAPSITTQTSLTTDEDHALTLNVNQFMIVDVDSSSFSLHLLSGDGYSVSGTTITPNTNVNGLLTVPVRVSDGSLLSSTFNATVFVNAINDAPVITGHNALSFDEDTTLTLTTDHLMIVDVDSSSFSLKLLAGEHYTASDTTIIPDENFFGTLTVKVRVNDGSANSGNYSFPITVNAVNDAPIITAQSALATQEDTALTLSPADFTINDVDSSTFTLLIFSGDHYQVSGHSIVPEDNFSGVLSVPVRVNDGVADSELFYANVTVSSINDVPVITSQRTLTTSEDTAMTLTVEDFTVVDEDSSVFNLSISAGPNYLVSGTLITPNENFVGTLTVPVMVNDGSANSDVFYASVIVTAVNDAPVLSGHIPLTINEDSELTLSLAAFEFTDEDSTGFELIINSGVNYSVAGNTIIPAENFSGELSIPVQVSDFSAVSNTLITLATVAPVNDAPIITGQANITVKEDTPTSLTLSQFNVTDVDSDAFSLSLVAGVSTGSNYTIAENEVIPAANFYGELLVPVMVSDGTENSDVFIALVNVTPVNDAPVVTSQSDINLTEDSPLMLSSDLLTFNDIDSTDFSIIALSGENYSIEGNQLIPVEDFNGTLTVPMQISDFEAQSNTFLATINVLPVNDAPVLNPINNQSIAEDTSFFISEDMLTVIDPDSSVFTVSIALGEHYQVAGTEIIPDADWFGELLIEITVSDVEFESNTETLRLVVEPVNDLPIITTSSLPTAQIYRNWAAQLKATDIDGDAVTFELIDAPSWVQLTGAGELDALPTENMIGEHQITVAVNDGSTKTATSLLLTVLDDPTATDTQVALEIERSIWATDAWVPVTINLKNSGPKPMVSTVVIVDFAGDWTTQDARCSLMSNQCDVDLNEQTTLDISVQQTTPGSTDVSVSIEHNGFEVATENNTAQLTLTFTDGTPTTPQYTVPNFGQGTVRAIALRDIQGGRWPEIMFANGPTEASTAYKFEKSLFRPILHSHLADASDSYAMALFDMDNDGDKDWVLANGSSQANTVYRNNGDGFFDYVGGLGSYSSRAVAYGDIDLDGDLDLVFANDEDPNTLYLNDGDGTFTLYTEFESRRSRKVIIHDFNRDGRPDIFFANRGFRHQLFINRTLGVAHASYKTGTETAAQSNVGTMFGFGSTEFGEPDDLATEATLADLDGDGIASDLVLANEANDGKPATLKVFNIDETGQSELVTETETATVTDLSIGDYDGDGKDDIGVLRPGGALEVMTSNAGILTTTEVMDTDGADTILMVDVDGGGQADIISANSTAQRSRLDFVGEVTDSEASEQEDSSAETVLKAKPEVVIDRPVASAAPKQGGAGVPLWLLALVLIASRKNRTL